MQIKNLPMFHHVKWNPDAADLRGFAIAMLAGFGALGCIALLRAGEVTRTASILWSVGAGLAAAAYVPGLNRLAYLAVYVPTSIVGFIVSNVLLAAIFYLVFVPVGLFLRMTGRDLLDLRPSPGSSSWRGTPEIKSSDSYYRQF